MVSEDLRGHALTSGPLGALTLFTIPPHYDWTWFAGR